MNETRRSDNALLDAIEARMEAMAQEATLWRVVFWFCVWAIGMWLGVMAMHIGD